MKNWNLARREICFPSNDTKQCASNEHFTAARVALLARYRRYSQGKRKDRKDIEHTFYMLQQTNLKSFTFVNNFFVLNDFHRQKKQESMEWFQTTTRSPTMVMFEEILAHKEWWFFFFCIRSSTIFRVCSASQQIHQHWSLVNLFSFDVVTRLISNGWWWAPSSIWMRKVTILFSIETPDKDSVRILHIRCFSFSHFTQTHYTIISLFIPA